MRHSLYRHLDATNAVMKKARQSIRLFAFDYDGTIYDGKDFTHSEVVGLVENIFAKDKSVAIITARAASALKMLVPVFKKLLSEHDVDRTIFIGLGNGTVLYALGKNGLRKIYDHGFDLSQIHRAVSCWEHVYKAHALNVDNLNEKGLETFRTFLRDDWAGYISDEIVAACRPYAGSIFAETAKVTFVLPKDERMKEKIIHAVAQELGERYIITAGDNIFAHITRRFDEDGKAVAVKTILQLLGLKKPQVATFGDMPMGNDKGLLSFPFSFTNSKDFLGNKSDPEKPPYIIANMGASAVAQIYSAVDALLR